LATSEKFSTFFTKKKIKERCQEKTKSDPDFFQ